MAQLSTLNALKNGLYGLLNVSADDDAMTEFESTSGETVEDLLQYGLWAAQEWLINYAAPDSWVKDSSALTWTGSDSTTGGVYSALPSDFLRLYGDDDYSALHLLDGSRWGTLIDASRRYVGTGDQYYILNGSLWLTRGASPPAGLVMQYYYKYPSIAAGALDMTDFPDRYRPLILAEAACIARDHSWFPGTGEAYQKLENNRREWRNRISVNARLSRVARSVKSKPVRGTHWFS